MRKANATGVFGAVLAAAMSTSVSAFASDAARAEALFNEAKKLMDGKKFDQGCPKFAESQELDPSPGTQINLARCYDLWGKSATAVTMYSDFIKSNPGDKRVATAQARIKALEPDLSKLTLMGEFPDGAVIRIDGKVVPGVRSGEEFPVDPGHHTIEISAPEKISRTIEFEADAGLPASLGMPTLEDAPAPEPPPKKKPSGPPPPPTPVEAPPTAHALAPDNEEAKPGKKDESSDGKRLGGWLLIGGGIVAANVGATFGVLAMGNASDVKALCPGGPCTTQAAIDQNDAAKTQALMADIFIPAGVVLVGVGTILVATSSSKPAEKAAPAALRVAPSFGRNGGSLSLSGAF